jgi:RNA polymerase sigma-70 factor, ECF subfamily
MPLSSSQAAEQAARNSYGRLLAILASRTRDIAAAEDALADAFLAALRSWSEGNIPTNPDAWLLTAARNSMLNAQRHQRVQQAAQAELERRYENSVVGEEPIPDERLKLLFTCAHPAIDAAIRAPLMLQTVLGLDAQRIAAAFLIAPTAMSQRLVRAKAKILDSGLRFAVAAKEEMPARLADVLNAIYAAYGSDWDSPGEAALSEEAIYLARLLASLLPEEPEARGLLALLLYCEARRPARRDANGRFVPLQQQNARLWSRDFIIEAEGHLTAASKQGRFGRFQYEAAIQSVHVQRPITGLTNYAALRTLYDLLIAYAPSIGAQVSRAAVIYESGDAQAAAQALHAIDADSIQSYQPYWLTLFHVLRAQNDPGWRESFHRALQLTTDPGLRQFLLETNPL